MAILLCLSPALTQLGNFGRPHSVHDKPKREFCTEIFGAVSANDGFHTTSSLTGGVAIDSDHSRIDCVLNMTRVRIRYMCISRNAAV
jgi:hypothetical protein